MSDCLWVHYARPRPHWYGLDAAAQAGQRARWQAAAAASAAEGGVCVGTWHVRGQHDFETVALWRFPDPDAAFRHWARLSEAGYAAFNAFANNIGLPAEATAGAPAEATE